MDREYEIFECLEDGGVMWRARATGLNIVRAKLSELSRETGKECFAMHLSTRDVVFAGDSSVVISNRAAQRIFHVGYDEKLSRMQAEFLRGLGYSVIAVLGNEAAKGILSVLRNDDLGITLFIIGHVAPVTTRKEMVEWLKANYPSAKVLALNPPDQPVPDADYNVEEHSPEAWVPIVVSTVSSSQAD